MSCSLALRCYCKRCYALLETVPMPSVSHLERSDSPTIFLISDAL